MALLGQDKLNVISPKEYLERFFGGMRMTKRQMKERRDDAEEFLDLVLLIFALIAEQYEFGAVDYGAAKKEFLDGYLELIAGMVGLDSHMRGYASLYVGQTMDTTKGRIEAEIRRERDKGSIGRDGRMADADIARASYYLSEERAVDMAANMALDVANYGDFKAAKGRYKRKKWLSMLDERVRGTHWEADSQVVPIDGLFQVGAALLAYPHDSAGALPGSTGWEHPEEVINCRCFVQYM